MVDTFLYGIEQTWMTKKSRATSEFVHVQRFEQQHTYVDRLLVPVGIIYRKVRVPH
jgi:hypothetical protein